MNNLVVLGNSVSIRIRPHDEKGKLYGELLSEIYPGLKYTNHGIGAILISEFLQNNLIDAVKNDSLVILNFGVVDACSRSIPKYLYDFMMNNDKKKSWQIVRYLVQGFENKFRKHLVKLNYYKAWTTSEKFSNDYEKLLALLLKKNCKMVALTINIPNGRVENQLPKSVQRVMLFNEIIRTSCIKHKVPLIETTDLNHDTDYPDGVHFNSQGHEKIAERLNHTIKERYLSNQ